MESSFYLRPLQINPNLNFKNGQHPLLAWSYKLLFYELKSCSSSVIWIAYWLVSISSVKFKASNEFENERIVPTKKIAKGLLLYSS